jgi:DNA-binding transcriptional ArsR family regulator
VTPPQVDRRLLVALGDPARQRVLTVLNERVATAAQISSELGMPEAEVVSHLEVLLENDAIEASEGTSFRATIRPFLDDAHLEQLPLEVRRALFAQNLRQIVEHLTSALAEDGFDDPRTHVSLTRMDLDRRGWDDVADLLAAALDRVMEIHAESVDRVRRGASHSAIPAELVVMHFRRATRETRTRVVE